MSKTAAPIIIFRFHHNYELCTQNLKHLAKLNPEIKIYGLYGGNDEPRKLPKSLTKLMAHVWQVPIEDSFYKWKNGDLCVRWWFNAYGHKLKFSHAYLIEWDLFYLRPLDQIFGKLQPNTNYGSLFASHAQAIKMGWSWILNWEYVELKVELKKLKLRPSTAVNYGIMGGAIFCRKFLEKFSALPPLSLTNDEVRFSLYSKAFGIPLKNNKLKQNPKNFVRADTKFITQRKVLALIQNGAEAIHPMRVKLPAKILKG